jgi:hypothetical protein
MNNVINNKKQKKTKKNIECKDDSNLQEILSTTYINSSGKRKCISMKTATSMDRCERLIPLKNEICGVHKRRKFLYLPDGSIWQNENKSSKIKKCILYRNNLKFWEIIESGVSIEKLNQFYRPETVSRLRVEKVSYLRVELKRLCVNSNEIPEDRYYWFLNLLYYLGNFTYSVKKIQNFYRGQFQEKLKIRKSAVKTIWKYYLNYKFKKLLPVFIHNYGFLKEYNCINECDSITQETFMEVSPERWVICQYEDMDKCWWFDISSTIQLLGSPGSHSGENPFNRKEYPPELLFDIEEKINDLKFKYDDLKMLTLSREELQLIQTSDNNHLSYYSYDRFKIHIKSNKLFESFKETGYYFPRGIFLKYTLGELRVLAAKIYESWYLCPEEERKRIFPPDGNLYPSGFINGIVSCSNSTLLKNTILDTLLKAVTFQKKYEDRIYGCLKTLVILGTINEESHFIVRENGLCDCGENIQGFHYNEGQSPIDILSNIMDDSD